MRSSCFNCLIPILSIAVVVGAAGFCCGTPDDDVMVIKEAPGQRNEEAFWYFCEKRHLQPLVPHSRVVVAEMEGPGVVRLIRLARLSQMEFHRGIVLEIYWDGAETPAVKVPVGDFFADGCNGKVQEYFASNFFEMVPGAYNCYVPMAFKKSAKIVLHNETDYPPGYVGYMNVEWEKLAEWNPEFGYFHAAYNRQIFRLTPETKVTFFEAKGKGHIVGRQVSVATDEPLYSDGFGWVMEGNVHFHVDGAEKADFMYLGSEDSFAFSHGFSDVWVGPHAGITYFNHTDGSMPAELSVFRLHDVMPIRFNESISWDINWQYETMFANPPFWREKIGDNGGWVDYACVTWFYLDTPAGHPHQPLRPVPQRTSTMLNKPSEPIVGKHIFEFDEQIVEPQIVQQFNALDVDVNLRNELSTPADMARLGIVGAYEGTHPFFIDVPKSPSEARQRFVWGHPGDPPPGRTGIVAAHPQGLATPCVLVRKVKLPPRASYLHVVVAGDPYEIEMPQQRDFMFRVAVFDGQQTHWLDEKLIETGAASEDAWLTLDYDLRRFAGQTVAVAVITAAGGANHWFNEEAFYDEISIVEGDLTSERQ